MVPGTPLDHILPVLLASIGLLSLGLTVTEVIHAVLSLSQRITVRLGFEPLDSKSLQHLLYRYLDRIFEPVLPVRDSPDQPLRASRFTHRIAFAGVVAGLAIILEVTSMLAVTGYAFAGYHFAGMTMNLTTAYTTVVATVVIFTIAIMSYSHERITHPPIR